MFAVPTTPLVTKAAAQADQSCNRYGSNDAGSFCQQSLLKMGSTLSITPGHTSAAAECVCPWQRSQPTTAPKTVSIHNNKGFRESTKALHFFKFWLKGSVWPHCAIMNHILKEHGVKSPHEEYLISVTLTHITNSVQLLHLGSKKIHIIWGHASLLVSKST